MRKYLQVAKMQLSNIFEYRGEIGSTILMGLLGIGAYFFLWQKIVKDYSVVGEYDLSGIMTYYLLAGIFSSFFNIRTAKAFDWWVREGELAQIIIKPIDPFKMFLSRELGARIGVILISALIYILPLTIIPGIRSSLNPSLVNTLWLLIFVVLSNLFLFLFYWTVGSFAFWTVETSGIRNITVNLMRILNGVWFPIDLAPKLIQSILSVLPFQYTMFYPIKIITSEKTTSENLRGIVVLMISILVLSVVAKVLWTKGLRKFNSVGI